MWQISLDAKAPSWWTRYLVIALSAVRVDDLDCHEDISF